MLTVSRCPCWGSSPPPAPRATGLTASPSACPTVRPAASHFPKVFLPEPHTSRFWCRKLDHAKYSSVRVGWPLMDCSNPSNALSLNRGQLTLGFSALGGATAMGFCITARRSTTQREEIQPTNDPRQNQSKKNESGRITV